MELADNRPTQFLNIEKIKKGIQMVVKYNHNTRKRLSDNVIEELSEYNDTLVPLPTKDGEETSYYDAWQERLKELEYHREMGKRQGKEWGVRKNAVLAFEVLCTVPKDKGIDIEEWKERTMAWLHDTFDVAGDGKNNILHAIYHGDEVGNHHIHAFVIPIDERGHLNAKRFSGSVSLMAKHQATYNNYIKDLGIKRGQAGSSAKHQKIKKLYSNLNKAMQVDLPKEGESAIDYHNRIVDDVETYYATLYKKLNDRTAAEQRKLDEIAGKEREAIGDELEKSQKIQEHEKKVVKQELEEMREERIRYQKQAEQLQLQVRQLEEQRTLAKEQYEQYQALGCKLEDARKWQMFASKVAEMEQKSPRKVRMTKAILEEVEESMDMVTENEQEIEY